MELNEIRKKTSITPLKKSSNKRKNQTNYHQNNNSPKTVTVQEDQFDDDNSIFEKMSLEDLNKKVEMYNSLFRENKINMFNAFQIDLISCVQQIVKKEKETNFVDIGITFDAISKVYTCRVDDVLASGNKLVKEFIMETKNQQNNIVLKKQEIDKMKPARKKLMLTTADKLRHKDNHMLPKLKFSSFFLDNNIIDYAKPSRILINKYSDKSYWPEYKPNEYSEAININKNPQVKYEMENLTHLIKKCKMCPYFNHFVAECDKSANDDYQNKLDSITTHFSPETSNFSDSNNHHLVEPYESLESMEIDTNESNSELIGDEDFSSSHKSSSNQDNSDSISQILSIVDAQNKNDYTFFDKNKLHNFECPDHWKDKFKLMSTTNRESSKTQLPDNHDSDSKTNTTMEKSKKIACTQFTVDFSLDLKKILKDLKNTVGIHKCDTDIWKPCIITPTESHNSPIRKLELCNYINMVPDWYRNEFTNSNLKTTENSLFLFSAHDGLIEEHSSLNDVIVPKKSEENVDNDVIMITDSLDESTKHKTDLNDDNYSFIENDFNDTQDDACQAFELPNSLSKSINMYELKKCIINVIKPGSKNVVNITFRDLLKRLPQSLPKSMIANVNVAIIFVALLHLCNEHILNLKDDNNEIYISQG